MTSKAPRKPLKFPQWEIPTRRLKRIGFTAVFWLALCANSVAFQASHELTVVIDPDKGALSGTDRILLNDGPQDVLPIGLHPIFAPGLPGEAVRIEGNCSHGETFPVTFEPGVSRLAAGARFETPQSLPLAGGGATPIGELLAMNVRDATAYFSAHPRIHRALQLLDDVCLGYLTLGQPAPTLSGGESQRLKVARELAMPSGAKNLYLLDEPTTGLHAEDVRALVKVLHELVERGHSVVVIEHNLDLIKTADWVIDLGPGAGELGGEVVACGSPLQIERHPRSLTGAFLAGRALAARRSRLGAGYAEAVEGAGRRGLLFSSGLITGEALVAAERDVPRWLATVTAETSDGDVETALFELRLDVTAVGRQRLQPDAEVALGLARLRCGRRRRRCTGR
mgnify:CR=1 FL=1